MTSLYAYLSSSPSLPFSLTPAYPKQKPPGPGGALEDTSRPLAPQREDGRLVGGRGEGKKRREVQSEEGKAIDIKKWREETYRGVSWAWRQKNL